ncbi:hypothetical protein [Actinomadura roseirufa]|uniref:hypothetical protein n=1 Tax=Actinomadura roseirufa TaxID=2094049 RepID=UPI00104123C9|nr:hypothetical protein [Actinomadura roseirufa]
MDPADGGPVSGRPARIGRFVRGAYPPLPSLLFAVAWAYGVTGLFAALDPAAEDWRPGAGTALAALSLLIDLLLMRALDDIRDLDYDRRFAPGRPLAAGVVRIGDLAVLYATGTAVLAALNAARPWPLALLLAQLGYAAAVVAVHHRWGRPPADRLWLSLLVSLPAPVLLHLYLYAGYLDAAGHGADRYGALAVAAVVLAAGHLELARKITRRPRPGERTYVRTLGVAGTTALALTVPVLSAALVLGASQAPPAWTALAVVPLAPAALAARTFLRGRTRWPPAAPPLYLLLSFASYLALGLTTR